MADISDKLLGAAFNSFATALSRFGNSDVLEIRPCRILMMEAMNKADPLRGIDRATRRRMYHQVADNAAKMYGYQRMNQSPSGPIPPLASRANEYWVKIC